MKSRALLAGRLLPVISVLTVLLFASEAYPEKTFAKRIIEAGSPIATVKTSTGRYVSVSQPAADTVVVRKVDSAGKRLWERALQFDLNPLESVEIVGIAQTSDGGYVLVGTGFLVDLVPSGHVYGIVIKLKPSGHVHWAKRLTKSSGSDLRLAFTSVSDAPDGGFVVTGIDCTDGSLCDGHTILLTFNSSGTVISAKSFGNRTQGNATIIKASGGGFLLAFSSAKNDTTLAGASLIRVSATGDILWKKFFKNFAFRAAPASDDGVILAGPRCDRHSCRDLFVVRLKSDGQTEWNARFTAISSIISDITQTSDGGYLLAGGGISLLKIDASGRPVFGTTFGESGSQTGELIWSNQLFLDADGGFLLFGSIGSSEEPFVSDPFDTLLLKLNSDGIVAGCSLSGSLNVSTRRFGTLKIGSPKIGLTNLSLEEAGLQVNLSNSKKQVSSACP